MSRSDEHVSPIKEFVDANPPAGQEFSEYLISMLQTVQPETMVEVGPDTTLRHARLFAGFVRIAGYTAVALEADVERAVDWIEYGAKRGLGRTVLKAKYMADKGGYEIEDDDTSGLATWFKLIPGNAIELSGTVPHADIILLHNVLLDLTGSDATKVMAHRRKEQVLPAEEVSELMAHFPIAQEKSYAEFLNVANPGAILTFLRAQHAPELVQTLTNSLGVSPEQISRIPLLYDDGKAADEDWELVIVDNHYLPHAHLHVV